MRVAASISKWILLAPVMSSDQARRALRIFAALSAIALIFGRNAGQELVQPNCVGSAFVVRFRYVSRWPARHEVEQGKLRNHAEPPGRRGVISEIVKVKDAMEQMAERWTHVVATAVAISIFGCL